MKTKIVEAECVLTIQYHTSYKYVYSLENIIKTKFVTDFASGGQDTIQITKLVKIDQINDYE